MFSDSDDYKEDDYDGCGALRHWNEDYEEDEGNLSGTGILKHWNEDS